MLDNAPSHRLRAILFTDLVDSVAIKTKLGPEIYLKYVARPHNELFQNILARFKGAEENNFTGDGFLATFNSVSDAVNAALLFQYELDSAKWKHDKPITRIGIHLGDVTIDQGQLYSLEVDMCSRVMSIACGRQILLTHPANEIAHTAVRVHPSRGSAVKLRWHDHGNYYFKGRDDPMEVFEVGADGFAPFKSPPNVLVPEWRPKKGRMIPGCPNWIIDKMLGEGAVGEVWLARNDKLNVLRVFKFCFDEKRLQTLKKELVFFRLIRDHLGDRPDIAALIDVRLDEKPYYLESEYVPLGNLEQWSQDKGGLSEVPLRLRIRLLAKIARAVAAAHSLRIIHQDIKPSNIFIDEQEDGTPQPKLADFGIGVLVDHSLLKTDSSTGTLTVSSSVLAQEPGLNGTLLYLPPEKLRGHPASVAGDIYALGVMLYQFLVGDFSRPLGVGWEADIPDDVLRKDITNCTHRDVDRRLQSAASLANRLDALRFRQWRWKFQKYFLAYRPSKNWVRVLHLLFYSSLILMPLIYCGVAIEVALMMTGNNQFDMSLAELFLGLLGFHCPPAVCWLVARNVEENAVK